jgi:TonB-dependent receptor
MGVQSLKAGVAMIALVGFAGPALAQTAASPVDAQAQSSDSSTNEATQNAAAADAGSDIVVTGVRASLSSAQALKQNASTIVDSIVAQDIGKLPDTNVTEALQRITGVQIARDYGEGSSVTIRGLPQVETTLNGREAFTAGAGRTFNFEDVAAELVSGIDVYKASQANLVEGGIGGTIDVRTHRPFDFNGLTVSGSARALYSDLVDKTTPLLSGLVSDRWQTGIGEIGLLVAATYQDRDFRNDGNTTGAPTGRTDLTGPGITPGETIASPNGTYDPVVPGERKRTGVDAVLQWRPADGLELYGEFNLSRFEDIENQRGINITTNFDPKNPTLRVPVPGSASVFPGTNIESAASFSNVPINTFSAARGYVDLDKTYSGGAKFERGRLKLNTDVSYTTSTNDLSYAELDLQTTAPMVTQDLTTQIPSFKVTGVDLNNINSYNVNTLTLSENHYSGSQIAATMDATYEVGGLIKSLQAGFRYADRKAHFYPVRLSANPAVTTPASAISQYVQPTPFTDFWQKGGANFYFPSSYLTTDPFALRDDFSAVQSAANVTTQATINPQSVFDIGERVFSGYLMANYEADIGVRIDGNVGVRLVSTQDTLAGFTPIITNGVQTGLAALNDNSNYFDALPSFNLRARFTDKFQARLAWSKTVTRPDFNQLSPTINLVPGQSLASGGNPDLKPIKSTNYDASLEYYFSRTNSIYVAGFYRSVDGFISSTSYPDTIFDGVPYTLTLPINGGHGTIKGAEIGYQQFFDFLPGFLSGFGIQANYTYVDSVSPSPVVGQTVPLPSLSKNSYNIVGMYEKYGITARIAYNWRSQFYQGLSFLTGGIGTATVYRAPYGWLDASISYDVTKNFSVVLEGSNLLRTKTQTYYTTPLSPNGWNIDDRQISAGIRFHF